MKGRSLLCADQMKKEDNGVKCIAFRQHEAAWPGEYQKTEVGRDQRKAASRSLDTYKENGFVME